MTQSQSRYLKFLIGFPQVVQLINAVSDKVARISETVVKYYKNDRFKPIKSNLDNRFGSSNKIQVKDINLPDLSLPEMLPRRANFSLFIPSHRKMAARMIEVFVGMRSLDDFMAAAVYCHDRMNPYMFIYALSVAILHRPDTQGLQIPSLCEVFPDKYMDRALFAEAREESNLVPEESRVPLEIPRDYTASDLDIEHRVAYFREDLGINLHHWHWHLVYPFDAPREIVNKDRRGELFFYMHQQIMARYNMERLCNNLARTKRLVNWRDPLEEGYFPKLDSLVASRVWPPRFANTKLNDVYREIDQIKFDLQDLERITFQETFSIMGDPATAMRDPIFYRWHAFVDDIFQEHKNTLPRYTVQQLEYSGVKITSVEVQTDGQGPKNRLQTFWQRSDVDLSRGMDFTPRGNVFARFTHLQHRPFTYKIQVENSGGPKMGTCRIFMAPKFDERGLPMLLRDQKLLFVELDKFTVNLKGTKNTITRKSTESSVTIPFERTFRNLDAGRPTEGGNLEQFNYCGCGWPQHMLICKGSAEGFPCELFVMISNINDDRVEQQGSQAQCTDAASYCGIRSQLYPDRRSMGYPFDRLPRQRADTLRQFLTPNMMVVDVTVQHTNQTVEPQSQAQPRRN
ncbi:Putative prophenoloxidase [Halyomorpha halys]|nr:Putative prophenoloxidase [Halyomorpha halys]